MAVIPRLADVQCTRLKFLPGDRILVRSKHRLDRAAQRKLRRTVERWAGAAVEVLIVCLPDVDVEIEHR